MTTTLDPASAAAANEWANVKNLGDMASLAAGLSSQNAVALQQRSHSLALDLYTSAAQAAQQIANDQAALRGALVAKATKMILDESALNASATSQEMTGNLQQKIDELNSVLSGTQQGAKIAQSTAPQTGTGGAFGSDTGSALLQSIVDAQVATANTLAGLQASLQAMVASLARIVPTPTPAPAR